MVVARAFWELMDGEAEEELWVGKTNPRPEHTSALMMMNLRPTP